jgi:hypothetical protein
MLSNNTNADKIWKNDSCQEGEQSCILGWGVRYFWFCLLCIVSVVYLYTKDDQFKNFEKKTHLKAHTTKILESFYETVERKLETADALSVAIVPTPKYRSDVSNVTLPDFEIRCSNGRSDTAVRLYKPVVTDKEQD